MQQLCYYKLFNYFENEKKLSIEQSKYTKAGFPAIAPKVHNLQKQHHSSPAIYIAPNVKPSRLHSLKRQS